MVCEGPKEHCDLDLVRNLIRPVKRANIHASQAEAFCGIGFRPKLGFALMSGRTLMTWPYWLALALAAGHWPERAPVSHRQI